MKTYRISLFFCISILAFSCNREAWFEEFVSMPEARWHADSAAVFTFEAPDTVNSYDLEFVLRSNENYPYGNLYLFVEKNFEGQVAIDTLEHIMALPEGKWTGKGYGAMKENFIRYRLNYRFEEMGKTNIIVKQGMRDVFLNGIEDVGFRISLSQEK